MTTASQIISSAMKKIGVLTKSSAPDADESADGLVALNGLLSSWSNESLFAYTRVRETFSLTAGTASYTIGTSQAFNTTRPISIVEAHITNGTTDWSLALIPDEVYQAISDKDTQSIPTMLNFNNGYPSATIYLWPTPSSSSDTLTITSEKPLVTLALSDTISLPPGWERALTYNLAVEIAPEYGVQVDPLIVKTAMESKGLIALAVSKTRPMTALNTWGNSYNILTGDY